MSRKRRRTGRRPDATGRSAEPAQYVNVSYRFLQSDAWRSLGGAAVKVYWELRARFNGGNNGQLHLSLEEAAALLSLGKATILRALQELEAKGFIRLAKRGQWYGRRASEYAVTDREVDGAPATNDWKDWRPDAGKAPRAPRYRRPAHKTKSGSIADHIGRSTGSETDRTTQHGSATAPVA
jgi:hypothetical protein